MVPDRLLAQTVTLIRPATTTDSYGNTVYDYDSGTRTSFRAWLQQDQRDEQHRDGRDPLDERWLMITNHDDIQGRDRIEWSARPSGPTVFDLDGPPEAAWSPSGFHHTEARLRAVQG